MFDQYDNEIKRLLASRVELVNDIWMARSLTMMNLVSNRLSNMAFLEIYTDVDVEDEFLTTRTLTDVAGNLSWKSSGSRWIDSVIMVLQNRRIGPGSGLASLPRLIAGPSG